MLRISFLLFLLALVSCQPEPKGTAGDLAQTADTLRLCLDWSPNVLHAGIFYALEKGWYQDTGLVVSYITPEIDDYLKKPIWRLQDGEVDLSIGPSEHQLHYSALQDTAPKVMAVATMVQLGTSCFVTKRGHHLDRPAALDGTTYLGYHTPLEREILQGMIRHDGGAGAFDMINPPRLDVWEAFLADSGQSCWIFRHWEGVAAETLDVRLHHFYPIDYGVPYGYSSLVYARADADSVQRASYERFLAVTARGYRAVVKDPAAAAELLCRVIDHPNFAEPAFIVRALERILPAYLDDQDQWGGMQAERFHAWNAWLAERELISAVPATETLMAAQSGW